MKIKIYTIVTLMALFGCKGTKEMQITDEEIQVTIDLIDVNDDKVTVSMDFPKINTSQAIFCIPKTVPGTYSTDNYGRFIENLKALDYQGNELSYIKIDDNKWRISSSQKLDKISYEVNDTYDIANEGGVFSPAGTNIEKNKNFMLNLHGFVGYIPQMENIQYVLNIQRPSTFYPGTALNFSSEKINASITADIFKTQRYFDITDNPIMYSVPDTLSFKTGGIEILLDVYSATGRYKAEDLRQALVKTITAQKKFLGEIDNTNKYAVLLYLSDFTKLDARGTGALEHNNSTVVVFSEDTSLEKLEQSLIDVVSHEFFHILTPLNVHSKEIHNFNYNDPKMSKHLWMYEGVTEYFANLFQVNQGLCNETEFFERMADKINTSKQFDDTVPFTLMSEKILTEEHKNSFYNVYQKGALIAMCLDIRLRELSNGKSGILNLMRQLSHKYGKDNPFDDDEILNDIVALTYPEIKSFFDTYVYGENPIPYEKFLDKVGLTLQSKTIETGYFLKEKTPYIDLNTATGEIYFRNRIKLNSFLEKIGVQGGDILKKIDGIPLNKENIKNAVIESRAWVKGRDVSFLIERNGKEILLKGKTIQPTETLWEIVDTNPPKNSGALKLRHSWINS
jgi:predicted metalloprotease with PDZ domain